MRVFCGTPPGIFERPLGLIGYHFGGAVIQKLLHARRISSTCWQRLALRHFQTPCLSGIADSNLIQVMRSRKSVFPRNFSAPQTGRICILAPSRQQESATARNKKTWVGKMRAKLHISSPLEVAAKLKTIQAGTTLSIQAFRERLAEQTTAMRRVQSPRPFF